MDRREFKKVSNGNVLSPASVKVDRHNSKRQNDNFAKSKQIPPATIHLQELGADLSVRAERMRIKARDDYSSQLNVTREILHNDVPPKKEDQGVVAESPSRIPVSHARQRRRENKEKAAQTKSRIKIQNYKPDYKWNRGGRVKELRIRCIARKFLFIWIRGVYGRVRLSKARACYERRLVRQTFGVWYDMWWELRKEWRLQVRAECHHRYILWSRVFQAWKEYIQVQRVKKAKFFTAQKHYVLHTEQKVMCCWKTYILNKREKTQLKSQADSFRQLTLTRCVWREWRRQMTLVHDRQEMATIALQFWAYRLQAQHWLLWHEAYQGRLSERNKLVHAESHQTSVLMSRCLHAWLIYHHRKQQKLKYKNYADHVYYVMLKTRYLQTWRCHLSLRQSLARHEDHMQDLAYRFRLRRCMQHWKLYVYHQHRVQEKEAKADNHHQLHLKTIGISAFRLYVVQQRLKVMRDRMSTELRHKQLYRRAWNHWLARCDSTEELKMMPLTQTARKHYKCVVMKKCFQSLVEYTQWRRHRKWQYSQADAHYYLHIVPQCVRHIKLFVHMEKKNRDNREKAEQFRSDSVYVRYMTLWQRQLEQSRENRMLERMAILHNEDKTVVKYFSDWRSRTAERLEENVKLDQAGEHYCVSLCVKHLRAWKKHVDDLKQRELDEVSAIRHHNISLLKKSFNKWKLYHVQRKEKDRLNKKATNHLSCKLLKVSLHQWKVYMEQIRNIKAVCEDKYRQKCSQHLRWAVREWREGVGQQVGEREQEHLACIHHNRHMLVKVLTTWHRFSAIHAYKKSQTRHLVEEARTELQTNKLGRYLQRWVEARNTAVLDRLKWEQAVQHHNNLVARAALLHWRQYADLQIRKNLLQRQSSWFLNVRLTAKAFLEWKQRQAESEVTNQKTGLALWHWSLVLLKKSVVTWYEYSQERKRKKQRVAEAMEGRRLRLLRTGAAQWLRVANDLAEMRGKFAAQQQAKSMFNTFQLVQKYALHWKYWAARRREERGGPLLPRDCSPRSVHYPTQSIPSLAPQSHQPVMPAPSRQHQMADIRYVKPSPALSNGVAVPPPQVGLSPLRPGRLEQGQGDGLAQQMRRERARPRKPAFLIESLKRAGLYASVYEVSENAEQSGTQVESSESQDVASEDKVANNDRISHHPTDTISQRACPPPPTAATSPRQEEMAPLHLNSSETEFSPPPNFISPSCSTQRSQPSGNPLHYSSPKADEGRHHKHHVTVSWKTGSDIITGNLDDAQPHKTQLLTPDDFLKKSDGSEIPARNGERMSYDSPRYLDSSSEAVPQSTRSEHHGSNKMADMYLDLSTVRSEVSISPADEVVQIRDKLKSFDGMKKRLRKLVKQQKQLSDWLQDQEVKGQEDEDVIIARNELSDLRQEMEDLKSTVERQKVSCQGLVERASHLVKLIEASM